MQSELKTLIKKFLLLFAKGEQWEVIFANEFDQDLQKRHLLVDILPVTPEATDICMVGSRYEWIVTTQVRIRDGISEELVDSVTDRLVEYCKPSSEGQLQQLCGQCGNYRFIRLPDPRPALRFDGWYSIPVDNRLELLT